MRITLGICTALLLTGCATPSNPNQTADAIQREMNAAAQNSARPSSPDAVNNALLPPLTLNMPKMDGKLLETKFDLVVNNTPVQQVYMAVVSGTRYSMLLNPDVSGSITLNLKDVTVFEALEAIRDMYGYDYKVDGTRIYIQPLTLQTRIYQVNYLTGLRAGTSSLRVSSGSIGDTVVPTTGAATNTSTNKVVFSKNKPFDDSTSTDITGESGKDSSKVMTVTNTDFWGELATALHAIVGKENGKSIVISPTSGVIVIRAMPEELKNVAAYLKASQISVERQVILEAKIVEVQLNDGFQSGVNWGAFKNNPSSRTSVGQLSPGSSLSMTGSITNGITTSIPGTNMSMASTGALPAGAIAGSLFGLAFQTSNFAALLNFLESQGNVNVLSSPRIATLNNQKAVLKVGTDEFFVTDVTGGTPAATGVAATPPTVKVQPFFSGIALDVTPRIDENGEIILHVHPSVSLVSTITKTVDFGASFGTFGLPLPSSSVSETDSIVRARDGQIVAIGGLMRQATYDNRSGLPGLPKAVFGQTNQSSEKRELVILLKPTIVDSDRDWSDDITHSRDRIGGMTGQGTKP